MAGVYIEWHWGWYVLIAMFLAVWIVLSVYRKDRKLLPQLVLGIIMTALAFVVEIIGISLGLWDYATGNWPAILWPTYFVTALLFYQITMLITKGRKQTNKAA